MTMDAILVADDRLQCCLQLLHLHKRHVSSMNMLCTLPGTVLSATNLLSELPTVATNQLWLFMLLLVRLLLLWQ